MSILKKLAGQTAIYGLPTIIGRLLNYLLVPLYTYNFTRPEYGTVNEMYAYVSFLLIILTFGMETALFNFSVKTKYKDKVYSTILLSVTIVAFLFISLFGVFSQSIANLIRHAGYPEYITWFAFILGFDAIAAIAFAKLRQQNEAKTFAAIKLLNIFTNIAFNVFFIWFCKNIFAHPESGFYPFVEKVYSPETGVGYIFISNLIASTVTLLVLLPSILRIKPVYDFSLVKEILPYALPLLVAGLAGMVNETMDRLLLKYLLPENIALDQVGVYGACYKLSLIMTIFIQTFRYAAEPFFFAHSVEQDARTTYARVMNYFVMVCLTIFLVTMFNLSWLKYFIGKNFWEGLAIVPILLIANFCLGVFYNLSIWYKLTNKTKAGAYIAIAGAVITVVLNVLLIPIMGYMGSAWATLICYASMMVVSFVLGHKYYPVPYNFWKMISYTALALLLYGTSIFMQLSFDLNDWMGPLLNNGLLIVFLVFLWKAEQNKAVLVAPESKP